MRLVLTIATPADEQPDLKQLLKLLDAVHETDVTEMALEVSAHEKRLFNEILFDSVRREETTAGARDAVHVERSIGRSTMFYDSDYGSLRIQPRPELDPTGSQLP